MKNQFSRYLLVGAFNTGFGYAIIFGSMYFLDMSPIASNALGYSIASVFSFVLNRTFTFKSNGQRSSELIRFLAVFAVAYFSNLAVLYVLVKFLFIHEAVSQIIAGVVYVVISYLMNKFLVFRPCNGKQRMGN
jgi:putative flippase GtrA